MQKIIVILGPTACGKTTLSISIAKLFHGEIISADSMQVYRGMNIGTAKITDDEKQGVIHHLIDICEPEESFSVANFQKQANDVIAQISSRKAMPIIVGGTGLYINSIIAPYNFSSQAYSDPQIRLRLKDEYMRFGGEEMNKRLMAVDPVSAVKIHPNDFHRTIRALEVYEISGRPLSSFHTGPVYNENIDALLIGLTMNREELYRRIDLRVDKMIDQGLIGEVSALLENGAGRDTVSMQGLGYKQIAAYLCGEISLEEAVYILKRDTRRFAKRQYTWFKRNTDINWYNRDHYREESLLVEDVSGLIKDWLKEGAYEQIWAAGTVPE